MGISSHKHFALAENRSGNKMRFWGLVPRKSVEAFWRGGFIREELTSNFGMFLKG